MKKLKIIAIFSSLLIMLTACGGNQNNNQEANNQNPENPSTTAQETVVVGATSVPHAEILNAISEELLKDGVKLEVKEFADYNLLNQALNDGQIDANFFQHLPYLEQYLASSQQKLVSVGPVHNEPLGIYSSKLKSIDEIGDKAKVGIPNDPTNESRALFLLQAQGLIKLKDGANISTSTPKDVVENNKNIEFVELDAAQLPRNLSEFDIAVINTNYVLETDLNPLEDALAMEDKASPFANILVVREGDESKESIQKLYKTLTSDVAKKFIEEKYNGAVVPAF